MAPATTELYPLSLHAALPISAIAQASEPPPLQLPHPPIWIGGSSRRSRQRAATIGQGWSPLIRSEEHTSELQSQSNLVCRLLLEKKKKEATMYTTHIRRNRRI